MDVNMSKIKLNLWDIASKLQKAVFQVYFFCCGFLLFSLSLLAGFSFTIDQAKRFRHERDRNVATIVLYHRVNPRSEPSSVTNDSGSCNTSTEWCSCSQKHFVNCYSYSMQQIRTTDDTLGAGEFGMWECWKRWHFGDSAAGVEERSGAASEMWELALFYQ